MSVWPFEAANGNALPLEANDCFGQGRCMNIYTVKNLVEKRKFDIHAINEVGETALDWAEMYGRTECAAVLRGYASRKRKRQLPRQRHPPI